MAYGNNRAGKQPRAHFQLAGGSIIKFKHPYLAGQIDATSKLDEIDVSSSLKLEGRYFEATPMQDSAKQVVLIDGSTVTICNKLLNGRLTLPVIRTTGLVGTGDFVAALQLIKSVGDNVGGVLTFTDFVNGKAITKLFYGVTVQNLPDVVAEGNDVPVYNCVLCYAGWLETAGTTTDENLKRIWAVGNTNGLTGYFTPYNIQDGGTGESMVNTTQNLFPEQSIYDSTVGNTETSTEIEGLTSGSQTPYSSYTNNINVNSKLG